MDSALRRRRRGLLRGLGILASGGDGSWEFAPWMESFGMGEAIRLCRLRHELMRFPIAVWVDSWGGLAGGEMKSADWSRGCDESQESADGMSILMMRRPRWDPILCVVGL